MKRGWPAALLVVAALLTHTPAIGQTIKLATLAPAGSPWHKVLMDMGSEWDQGTSSRVKLRIYPGGIAGDDPDMVRKMRINQLHGGALTVTGLGAIDPTVNLLTIPMFFDSFEEYEYVLEKMTPLFTEKIEARGFILLLWVHGGWVHLFSKEPVHSIGELRSVKLFTWAGDESMVQMWKMNGFRPVALAATDVLTGLQTGMIDAMPTTPLAALSMQWFTKTPYMLEPGVAPLPGGVVISKTAWEKISVADRQILLASAARAEERLSREIPQRDREAIDEMRERGLTVNHFEPEQAKELRIVARQMADSMRGRMSKEAFVEIKRHRDEYRASHPSEEPR
jgi:TRAP-type C4-dicarboxylate transport system substrate-binding protein